MKFKQINDCIQDLVDDLEETELAARALLREGSLSPTQRELLEALLSHLVALREQAERGLATRMARLSRQQPSRGPGRYADGRQP